MSSPLSRRSGWSACLTAVGDDALCALPSPDASSSNCFSPGKRPYDLLPGIALIEELRSESLNPLSACHNFSLSLLQPLTQIKTRPPRSAMLSNVRAGHGRKPGRKAAAITL